MYPIYWREMYARGGGGGKKLEERADRSIGGRSGKRDGTREDPSFRGGRDHRREADEKPLWILY